MKFDDTDRRGRSAVRQHPVTAGVSISTSTSQAFPFGICARKREERESNTTAMKT